MRRPLAAALLALTAAACTSGQADPAASRTRLTITQPVISPTPAAGHTVVFEAEGAGGVDKASHATYGAGAKTGQDVDVPLPYSKTLHVTGRLSLVTLFVQNPGADGSVSCRVRVDGKVVREAKSDGPYGVCRIQVDSLGE